MKVRKSFTLDPKTVKLIESARAKLEKKTGVPLSDSAVVDALIAKAAGKC